MAKVIRRNCTEDEFKKEKISNAILKAMTNGSGIVKAKIAEDIANEIYEETKDIEEVSISEIEQMVFDKLISKKQRLTARAYEGYRSIREFQREENELDDVVYGIVEGTDKEVLDENSNKNAYIAPTQRDLIAGELSRNYSRRNLLPINITQAHDEGIIHFHDADYFIQRIHNCQLVNLEDMLQNGTVINTKMIEKPKSFQTACTVATQIVQQVANSQYGGQTITLSHLAPFVRISREKWVKRVIQDFEETGVTYDMEHVNYIADKRLREEIKAGIQTIQFQVNTFNTSNGQSPFLTVFMYISENPEYEKETAMLIEEVLNQRYEGMKNEVGVPVTPSFPKLIFVLDENNVSKDSEYYYLKKLACKCVAKRMMPDFISAKIMKQNYDGEVFPCMGCVDGKEIITYRMNNKLYVESFERMWNRLTDVFEVKHQYSENNPNLYMDLENIEIYDTEKGFVDTKRIIRNVSNNWVDVHLSNGRRLLCTENHPFELLHKGETQAKNLKVSDKMMINSNQYNEETIAFNSDKAWLLGFMLCDGCYQSNHIFASIAAEGEDEIEEKFHNTFSKYFGLDTKTVLQERGKKGTYKDLVAIADENGNLQHTINYFISKFGGINKVNRHIPNEVYSWTYEAKMAFLAGMIDADGYLNDNTHGGSVVQIGSTNKELALQQMALAQALGMPAKIYHNHYTKKNPNAIRYRVEFYAIEELLTYIVCEKKCEHYEDATSTHYNTYAEVVEVLPVEGTMYSYDVTTDSEHFEVSGIYSHNCRSFLSNWKDENGKYKWYGRFNQGVVTLNLVDVGLSADKDMDKFWDILDERLRLCYQALMLRHERLEGTSTTISPIHWQYGAIARLSKDDKIDDLLHNGYSTISLGYAGLYECVLAMLGVSHTTEEGERFALAVMNKLKATCDKWKKDTGIGFGLYGTPLESTTYKFARKLRDRFGVIEGITDKEYITNSYHVNVKEEIDAFRKLGFEAQFQKISSGGAVSYVEVTNLNNNLDAIEQIVDYMYDTIQYAEINTKSDYCQVCGFDGEILLDENLEWYCPNCGNRDHKKMNVCRRTCGYLGDNFWNRGRTQDINDRYIHLDNHIMKEGC